MSRSLDLKIMVASNFFRMFRHTKPSSQHALRSPSEPDAVVASSCRIQSPVELRKIFAKFDTNGDGKISSKELESMLRSCEDSARDFGKEAEAMVRAVDADGDGFIQFEEFAEVMETDDEKCLEDLRQAFAVYDRNGDGRISARELRYVMRRMMGERTTMAECRRMIRAVDRNGDGVVSFDEFVGMMRHSIA